MNVAVKFAVVLIITVSTSLAGESVTYPKAASKQKAGSTTQASPRDKLPRFRQFTDEAQSLLRAEASAETETERVRQALGIIELVDRLAADPRYPTSATLQEIRGRLRARLRRIKKRAVTLQRRQKKRPRQIEIKQEVLAQLNQAANGVGANANNNQVAQDYGPLLIDLIQRTISPSSWDVNGGVSTIRYWRPGMALVIRAPQSLHEELTPVLRQLRTQ